MAPWPAFSDEFIRKRYKRLAPVYPVFELVFWLPFGIRRSAVAALGVAAGGTVVEIGCGTGRNFPYIVEAIGSTGRLYGVDFSPEMLAVARERCARAGWTNVSLLERDARDYRLPEPVDAALFSLSYAVFSDRRAVLRQTWAQLCSGGRLVVMDAKAPHGWLGRLTRPVGAWVSRATVLGDPDRRPWEDLRELTDRIEMEELVFGTYYICRATKSPAA